MQDITNQTGAPENVATTTFNFPSHFVDPEIKKGKEWNKQYMKAFHAEAKSMPTEASLFRNNASYARYRRYARGEQSQDQYKELLGLTKNQGKLNTSYRNLDFSIFKIAPKVKNVVMSRILGQDLKINVKPIDQTSLNERREAKNEILEYVVNQEHIQRFQMLSRLGLPTPQQGNEAMPQSPQEIDPYLDMNPKDSMAMEVKDYLTLTLALNDWPQLSTEIASDLFDIGVAACRPYIDSNGLIKLRRGMPERMVMNKCVYSDFRDAIRVAEYYEMTISELKQRTQNSLGEETYKQLANSVAGKTRSAYTGAVDHYWSDSTYTYAYDHEKITVMEGVWFSEDRETHVEEKNYYGNARMRKKKFNYVPYRGDANVNAGKGMTDEEFNKADNGKTIYRKEVKNVYQCSWIVDTDVVFDYGLMTNMLKQASALADAQLPWTIMTTDFMSAVGNIESALDQFQLNWLQFQSHIAASKPPGVAIEKRALAKLATGGQGGQKWDPRENLVMYAETGSFVFDGYDQNGNPLPWLPFKELMNGLSPAAMEHWNIMIQMLDMIRTLLGTNGLVEGQQPQERLGKGVAQISMEASANALDYITGTYKRFYEKVCNQITLMMPNAMEVGQPKDIEEALGTESAHYFSLNKDLPLRDMGITIEAGPDDVVKQRIFESCQVGIEKGWLMPENAIQIQLEENYFRAILMLRKYRLEFQGQQQEQQKEMIREQGQVNAQNQAAATQAQFEAEKKTDERKLEIMKFQAALELEKSEKEFTHQVILEKLKQGHKMSEMEQKVIDDVIRIHAQGQVDINVATIGAEAKEKSQSNQNQ